MPLWQTEIRKRLDALQLSPTREAAIVEELAQHLDDYYAEVLAGGATEAEAYQRTLAELSGNELLARELRRVEQQITQEPIVLGTNRRTNMIADLGQDLRYGARMLLKHRSFTLIAVLTLALGIGATTAILSAVNGFILRPLPVTKPDELVTPFWGSKNKAQVWGGLSYANYVDLRAQNQSLSGMLVWSLTSAGVSAGTSGDSARAEVAWGELVSANYFDVLGVKPILGRGFLPAEERTQNTHPVVVISHSLWRQQFNGDAGIVGKTIYMNGTPFTVVGVAPATFKGLKYAFRQAFWIPLMMSAALGAGRDWEATRGWAKWNALARLKPGVTREQAEADLNRIVEALGQQYPKPNADKKVQLLAERDGRLEEGTEPFRLRSLLALCAAGLVLLLACANVANLLLARATVRAKELGIRLALGAGRGRIVRQLLTESLLLALVGGGLGLMFAYGGTALLNASVPPIPYPIEFDFSPDWYVLKWTLAVTLATSVTFGLLPALAASRPDLVAVIKGSVAGQAQSNQQWRRWNLRSALVVAQVAISIVVLIYAGLFLRSLNQALKLDPGFSTENLVTMKLDPGLLGYNEAAGKRFYAESLRRVAALPGVRAASLASFLPLGDSNDEVGPVTKEGEGDPLPNQGINVSSNRVAPGYFATVKTPLVRGRDFTERDTKDAPLVVIVNQEFARRFYGSEENALGQRLRFWNPKAPLREIVGIAQNGLYLNLYEAPRPYIYLPEYQLYQSSMMLLVSAQTAGDLRAIAENVRREITQLDVRVPVTGITLAEANLSFAYWAPRRTAGMASALGLLALLLAALGLYSVMTYTIEQRTREMGIRMALGAQVRDVLRLIVWQGMRLVVIGLALGLACALALTRWLASLIQGVGATDPLTFAGVALLLVAVALLACWLPARRATRVDPLLALRCE
jgi:macrolide transport system ATP-binding/permease protein